MTDRQIDAQGKNNMSPNLKGGRHNYIQKIKGLGLLVSDKKIFEVLSTEAYVKHFDLSIKKIKVNPRLLFFFFNFYLAHVPNAA